MAVSKVDIFIKLDGIEGEAQDDKHKNEIEVQSFSFGLSNSGSFAVAGGGGSKHANLQDVHFTKLLDKSSPKLFEASATGHHIKKGEITFRKAGQKEGQLEYFKVTLTDLLVSSYQLSDHAGATLPNEQVSLNYAKIEFDYKEQKADGSLGGSVKAGYDLKLAKKV
jgi:type VI secretion system secreted protein Hcp